MQVLSTQSKWKPWLGAVWFVICLLILLFPGAYVQAKFGMIGLLLSELIFLAAAIIYTLIMKTPLKEVFPVKKIGLVELIGVCIFAAGAISANMFFAGLGMIIFPDNTNDVQALTDFIMGEDLSFLPLSIILALSPAICEEAIMRGVLLSHFRGLKKEWIGILCVGIAFGILHLSPVKFLSTGVLGACLAYLVVKKNNIILPMIVHFLNNMLSVVSVVFLKLLGTDAVSSAASTTVEVNTLQNLGSYMVLGCAGPILILVGIYLMKCTVVKPKAWIIAGIASGLLFIGGFGITISSALLRPAVLNSTIGYDVVEGEQSRLLDFTVEEGGEYIVVVTGEIERGSVEFAIIDKETETLQTGCTEEGIFVISQQVILDEGEYWVTFNGLDGTDGARLEYVIQIQKLS